MFRQILFRLKYSLDKSLNFTQRALVMSYSHWSRILTEVMNFHNEIGTLFIDTDSYMKFLGTFPSVKIGENDDMML